MDTAQRRLQAASQEVAEAEQAMARAAAEQNEAQARMGNARSSLDSLYDLLSMPEAEIQRNKELEAALKDAQQQYNYANDDFLLARADADRAGRAAADARRRLGIAIGSQNAALEESSRAALDLQLAVDEQRRQREQERIARLEQERLERLRYREAGSSEQQARREADIVQRARSRVQPPPRRACGRGAADHGAIALRSGAG
jgi:hypothetical protein